MIPNRDLTTLRRIAQREADEYRQTVLLILEPPATPINGFRSATPYCTLITHASAEEKQAPSERFEPNEKPKRHDEIPPPDSDADRARRFRRMARKMAEMIEWPPEDSMTRAGGDVVCEQCGLPYIEHPEHRGLHLTCEGRLVKL